MSKVDWFPVTELMSHSLRAGGAALGGFSASAGGYSSFKYSLDSEYFFGLTLEQFFSSQGLKVAREDSEFKEIFEDMKKYKPIVWSKNKKLFTNDNFDQKEERTTLKKMKSMCGSYMGEKISELGLEIDEIKVLKVVCTKNYSLLSNAKEYYGLDKVLYEGSTDEESNWNTHLTNFKSKNTGKGFSDLKKTCSTKGQDPYRIQSTESNNFYNWCVKTNKVIASK